MNKFLILGFLIYFSSCSSSSTNIPYNINIVAGTSKITGKITSPDGQNIDSIMLTITLTYPITGENVSYEVRADSLGKFSLDFDMETEASLLGLYTSVNPHKVLYLKTLHNDSTYVEITYDSNLDIANVDARPAMNKYDIMQTMEIFNKIIDHRRNGSNWKYPHLYDKSIDEFLGIVNRTFLERVYLFVDNDNFLSKECKQFITKDYRLFLYTAHVFDYESEMKRNYRNARQDTVNLPTIHKRDRSYFRFLKDFNLNDPQYLHTFTFSEFQDSILSNSFLELPIIGDREIPSWLAEVRSILSDLVGFEEGFYYDILAANAYGRQLREEARPLSKKQKQNITSYWNNGEIAKILFRKNVKVIEYDKSKSPTVVHDIASVPKEMVVDELIDKYKNKVVFIDIWATWCGPCLQAMNQFNRIKGDFKDTDIVFVYITNTSSPKNLWEEKIKGIGHEHYYLNEEQWEFLMNNYKLEYIPSYLIYNKEGVLKDKFSSFPGNDIVKEKLEKLINKF
ncbi:MAG: TlpA family protein disulfide reductase [Sphingobacterium composti]